MLIKRTVHGNLGFFVEWLKIIKAYNPLTDKENDLLALLLTKRYELSNVILDEAILSKILFDKETKAEIVKALDLKDMQTFENLAHSLRKKGVITKGNLIHPAYIPRVEKNFKEFLIGFKIVKEDD